MRLPDDVCAPVVGADTTLSAEQDTLINTLLNDAVAARRGYCIVAALLLLVALLCAGSPSVPSPQPDALSARRMPQRDQPLLVTLLVRASLLVKGALLAYDLVQDEHVRPFGPVDATLLVAPAASGILRLLTSTQSALVCTVPFLCLGGAAGIALQGEALVRDARELDKLKYAAPGA